MSVSLATTFEKMQEIPFRIGIGGGGGSGGGGGVSYPPPKGLWMTPPVKVCENSLPSCKTGYLRLTAAPSGLIDLVQLIVLTFSKSLTPSILQQDLQHLESCEKAWDMEFNPSKCQVIHIRRSRRPTQNKYYLHGALLEAVPAAKYLGVDISENLSWNTHISRISKKSNQTLGFLKRNIKIHHEDLKATAYKTVVRPQLEYASSVWSPHTDTVIQQIEKVQRCTARWVKRDYSRTSSVTAMLQSLNWRRLDLRCIDNRLSVMYKVTHDLVAIPRDQYLTALQRQSRTSHLMAYRQIATSTDYIKYSFFLSTVVHWNSLPPEVVSLPNVDDFNRAVSQMNPRRFAPKPFPPLVVSPPRRFLPGRFPPSHFAPLVVSPTFHCKTNFHCWIFIRGEKRQLFK